MNWLKYSSFTLLAITTIMLAIGSIIEKAFGSFAYSSLPMITLWLATACSSITYLLAAKMHKHPLVLLIHMAFLVILVGAGITCFTGFEGKVNLRQGQPISQFTDSDRSLRQLPFTICLNSFEVKHYAGTLTPLDFVSHVTITHHNVSSSHIISMNNILNFKGYRFYQSGYDSDQSGSILSISHDPAGVAVSYAGYLLLLVSFIAFLFARRTMFRALLKQLRTASAVVCILLGSASAFSHDGPKVLPEHVAYEFCDLYTLHNGRICPIHTLAHHFTTKLYGSDRYKGLSPEQVLTGWFFFTESWTHEPIIKIKSASARRILGIGGKYASAADFFNDLGQNKLQQPLSLAMADGSDRTLIHDLNEAFEKLSIAAQLSEGHLLKIFPDKSATGIGWYGYSDELPSHFNPDKEHFMRMSMSYLNSMYVTRNWQEASAFIGKLHKLQHRECGDTLPTAARTAAENIYNTISLTKPLAMLCLTMGIALFVVFCIALARRKPLNRFVTISANIFLGSIWIYLTAIIALRWFVSDHIPLSNGFETMQFLAWCSLLLTFSVQRHFSLALPFGCLICGLSLLVSMMGEANPQITQLMPVLQSPLLSIHVAVIMLAYAQLAFLALNGITAFILHISSPDAKHQITLLTTISRLMLYPAVFLLAIGIFIGAVWANVSWGRYWGWDPKEVWALITMIVYAVAIHQGSLPILRHPLRFHLYCSLAFISVIITYFGVNFLLGGMHSYA